MTFFKNDACADRRMTLTAGLRVPVTWMLLAASVAAALASPAFGQAAGARPPTPAELDQLIMARWTTDAAPVEPFRVVGDVYFVGTSNIFCFLVKTPSGHVLIDTGTPVVQRQIAGNIAKLGLDPQDVKIILTTHAHFDHVGGHAAMRRATGAVVIAMEQEAPAMASGKDMSVAQLDGWEPIPIDRIVRDNETVELGGVSLRAILAPGNTPGNTIWVVSTTEGKRTYQIAFGGPPEHPRPIVGNPRFDTPAEQVVTAFRRLRELNPDFELQGHDAKGFNAAVGAMRERVRPHPLQLPAGEWQKLLNVVEADYARRRR